VGGGDSGICTRVVSISAKVRFDGFPAEPRFGSNFTGSRVSGGFTLGFSVWRWVGRLGSPRRGSAPRCSAPPRSPAFASGRHAGCRFNRVHALGVGRVDSRGIRSVALQGLVGPEQGSAGVRGRRESDGVSRWVPSPAFGLVEFGRVSGLFFDKQVVEVFLAGPGVRFPAWCCLRAVPGRERASDLWNRSKNRWLACGVWDWIRLVPGSVTWPRD
jgi:hypothetical protein